MKQKVLILFAASLLIYGCSCNNKPAQVLTISPDAGTTYKAGDEVKIKLSIPDNTKVDSVVYTIDSIRIAGKKDTSAFSLKTDTMPLGSRLLTAKVFAGGQPQEISTNIVLLAAKAPEMLSFKVEKTYPHDTSSYTEGLVYQDGFLYESAGDYGHSSLRRVDLNTGRVLQMTKLDDKYFGEGISIVGDKIVQLTYKEKVGFVYDKSSFKLLSTFTNNVGLEGWGMCFDGKKLYTDDSTNRIWFLNKDNYRQIGFIDVCDDKNQINQVNELEYIDGKLYANIYQTNTIIVIDPKTGAVLQQVDLSSLYPQDKRAPYADVLNGIAWDAQGKRLFITGKKWPKLYQVSFSKM